MWLRCRLVLVQPILGLNYILKLQVFKESSGFHSSWLQLALQPPGFQAQANPVHPPTLLTSKTGICCSSPHR
ncbi:hypothetical protein CRENBAI_025179 [Crenichthys baileyi]|uniref:Uncharacterized protein n=1 Tax=Crenichthys baileyi TaxID=28760 RepID=A0AAV9RPN3_9TELE